MNLCVATRYQILNCFTASTQRPQMVGCSAFWRMSVSQCQQRSHFWPSAFVTVAWSVKWMSGLISNWDTFISSRKASASKLKSIFEPIKAKLLPDKVTFASSAFPMAFVCLAFSNSAIATCRKLNKELQVIWSASDKG